MSIKTKKHLLSMLAVTIFIMLAFACKVNKIHYGAFQYGNNVEKPASGNYLVRNDGTTVPGEKISWKSGLLSKEQIKIDDQTFKMSEIRGYRQGDTYYGKHGNSYIKRIVHGKVNVYVQFTEVTSTTTDRNGFTRMRTYTRTDQYGQVGEDGKMVPLAGQKDIKALVQDCPKALEMASLSNKGMKKAIKANPNYLNSIFEVYNNGCE